MIISPFDLSAPIFIPLSRLIHFISLPQTIFTIFRIVSHLGMCEALWEPDLEPEDLFESTAQALLNSQDRDALAGWGGIVYVM